MSNKRKHHHAVAGPTAGQAATTENDTGQAEAMDSTHGNATQGGNEAGSTPGADGRTEASRTEDIRGVLIQVAGARLLLPNAAIAEVLSYADPEPVANTPDWLLGRIRWRGWQLPLIAFSRLAGLAEEQAGLGSKVVILKTFGGNPKFPFFALLTHGFPRLVTVSQAGLVAADDGSELPAGVTAQVRLNEDEALLPDIERLEHLIGEALAQAA